MPPGRWPGPRTTRSWRWSPTHYRLRQGGAAEVGPEVLCGHHETGVVDREGLGARAAEDVERVLLPGQENGLGQDLGYPRLAGDDGGQRDVRGRRQPGLP